MGYPKKEWRNKDPTHHTYRHGLGPWTIKGHPLSITLKKLKEIAIFHNPNY